MVGAVNANGFGIIGRRAAGVPPKVTGPGAPTLITYPVTAGFGTGNINGFACFAGGAVAICLTTGALVITASKYRFSSGKGKFFVEACLSSQGGGNTQWGIGNANSSYQVTTNPGNIGWNQASGFWNGASSTGTALNPGDVTGLAMDYDRLLAWAYLNGVCLNGDPIKGTGGAPITSTVQYIQFMATAYNAGIYLNTGQGPYLYPPPSIFSSWG